MLKKSECIKVNTNTNKMGCCGRTYIDMKMKNVIHCKKFENYY